MLTTEVREVFAVLRPGADRDRRVGAGGRRVVPLRRLPARRSSARSPSGWSPRSASRRAPGGSIRPRTRSAPRSRTATCGSRRATGPTTSSRSGRRSTRPGTASTRTASRTRCSARRSPVRPRSGSTSRRAARGRTSSAAAGRSGSTGTSRSRRRSHHCARSSSTTFVRAINRAEPGLIRVDADETTYSLHIILRFELEQELLEGTVALEDLPEVWNARMKEFLGVDVPDDAHGVLQDVHWSGGWIGYFPTYALGNVISLQLWDVVRRGAARPRRPARRGRRAAALRLAARQPLLARAQADAEGDDRAADRLARASTPSRTSRTCATKTAALAA